MEISQSQLKAGTFAKWKTAMSLATKQDQKNAIFAELFDKVSVQRTIDTFQFVNPLLDRYLKASSNYGGLHEINNFDFSKLDAYDKNAEWWKEKYFVVDRAQMAVITFEDKYWFTMAYDQMQRAFLSETQFGSAITQIKASIPKKKELTWYNRIINMHKEYTQVLEVEITDDMTDDQIGEKVGRAITQLSQEMELPNEIFNETGRTNATPIAKQFLTWNVKYKNLFQWTAAKLFNGINLGGKGQDGMLNSVAVNYGDEDIIGVIDSDEKIYLSMQFETTDYQSFASLKLMNNYKHETWITAVVPFADGVIIKKKGSATGKKS